VNRATAKGEKTIVGSHNNFLAYTHIAHDCIVGNHCIFSNNGTLAGHVTVEDHVILGGLSAVHQFCRIGQHSFIGGCAKIVQDIPPFTTVDGNPGRARGLNETGLKRHGYSEDQVKAIYSAYRTLYRKGLNTTQAIAEIRSRPMTAEVEHFTTFIETAKRGVVGAGKVATER
jgi:UDP-N-acetylglucosamine acyltransferase